MAVLSGPNIADEIVRGLPAAAVIACESLPLAVQLQLAINSTTFRVYVNDDLVGVELCAAAKNVIALAAGGADGLGLGDNAKAALVARGLAEMGRLAEVAGARPETFAGLAGMGDLIVTCWSPSGRNRRCGELVAQGATPEEAARADRHGRRGADDRARCSAISRTGSRSRCRSRRACAPCSTASPLAELVAQLMRREPTSSEAAICNYTARTMGARSFQFSSESVTEGHPDKIADQISDAVLDAVLRDDPNGRVACETLITTGLVVVAGEITTETYVDIRALVRETIAGIGYTRAKYGFDAETCGVMVAIDEQSSGHRAGRRRVVRGAARQTRTRSTASARATRG